MSNVSTYTWNFILFGVSGTAKAPSGFNATAAGGVHKAYLTSYIK